MDAIPALPNPDLFEATLQAALSEEETAVRWSALEFLSNHGTREAAEEIANAEPTQNAEGQRRLSDVRFSILARENPVQVLIQLLDASEEAERPILDFAKNFHKYQTVIKELRTQAAPLSPQALARMLRLVDPDVREFAASKLVQSDQLSPEQAASLVRDESPNVRALALEWLASHGGPYDEKEIQKAIQGPERGKAMSAEQGDHIRVEFFRRMPLAELKIRIDWYDVNGPLAYMTAGLEHFESEGAAVRKDLADGFQAIHDASAERLARDFGGDAKGIVARFKEGGPFIRTQFIKAALAILARMGERPDAHFAREFVTQQEGDVQKHAVALLGRCGDPTDAETLLTVARGSRGEVKRLAVEGALRLGQGSFDALLTSGDHELVTHALRWALDKDIADLPKRLEPLLAHEDSTLREKALAVLSKKLRGEDMERLLKAYVAKESYYYNVVCWLDRILYSPPPMREFFRRELASKLGP